MAKKATRALLIIMILLVNISCDRVSKNIVTHRLEYNERIDLIGQFLTLTRVENSGAFLSLGYNLPEPFKLIVMRLIPVLVLIFALLFVFLKTSLKNWITLGICLAIAGGVGNIYDRIIFGRVTDFIHMDFVIFQTGIFNLADLSLMTGMCIILIGNFYNDKKPGTLDNVRDLPKSDV